MKRMFFFAYCLLLGFSEAKSQISIDSVSLKYFGDTTIWVSFYISKENPKYIGVFHGEKECVGEESFPLYDSVMNVLQPAVVVSEGFLGEKIVTEPSCFVTEKMLDEKSSYTVYGVDPRHGVVKYSPLIAQARIKELWEAVHHFCVYRSENDVTVVLSLEKEVRYGYQHSKEAKMDVDMIVDAIGRESSGSVGVFGVQHVLDILQVKKVSTFFAIEDNDQSFCILARTAVALTQAQNKNGSFTKNKK